MKRIYLLMLFVVAVATNSFGRNVDLRMNHYIGPAGNGNTPSLVHNGTVLFSNGDTVHGHAHMLYKIYDVVANISTTASDSVMKSDSLYVFSFLFGRAGYKAYLPIGDSLVFGSDSLYLNPLSYTTSGSATWNYCDTVILRNGSSVTDPNPANNITCATVTFNYFATSIEGLQVLPNAALLYPNPAKNTLNLLYNFEAGAKGANVMITDAAGRVVLTQDLGHDLIGSKEIKLDNISTLRNGMYFLQLRTDEGKTATAKFLVQ